MEHHLGHAAGQKDLHRRMADRAVRQGVDQPRHAPIRREPVVDRRPLEPGGKRHGRHVQQQIRRAAEGGMHDHGIANRSLGQNVCQPQLALGQPHHRPGAAPGHVEPDRLAARRQGRVGQRQAERLGHDLRCGSRAQELAAAAGAAAGPASQFAGGGQRHFAVCVTGADRLDLPGVFRPFGRQRHAAGNQNAGQIDHAGQGQHHRRQSLVAGRHAQHALASRQRTDQTP